jgi:hypothetical protein
VTVALGSANDATLARSTSVDRLTARRHGKKQCAQAAEENSHDSSFDLRDFAR